MLSLHYKCACCNHMLSAQDQVCSQCGSQHIKSPYGFWALCVISCLMAVIIFKVVHLYLQDQGETPRQISILKVLQQQK